MEYFESILPLLVKSLNPSWYPALEILYRISKGYAVRVDFETRDSEIRLLSQYGVFAKDCLSDGKPVLADILAKKQLECTEEELGTIYAGLKDLTCDATLTQFDKEVSAQIMPREQYVFLLA